MEEEWSGEDAGPAVATSTTAFAAPRPIHATTAMAPTTTTSAQIHTEASTQIPPWGMFLIFITVCLVLVYISRKACSSWWSDAEPSRPLPEPGSVLASMAADGSRLSGRAKKTPKNFREELEMTLLEDNDLDEDELVFGRARESKMK